MTTRISLTAVVILMLVFGNAHAQSLFDALNELAKTYNEQEGEPSADAAPADNEWSAGFKKTLDEYQEVLGEMDKDSSCVAMMVLYVYEYERLLEATDRETSCQVKYDLYGMQLLSLASSTTIMYCPEGLSKYSDEKLTKVSQDYWGTLRNRIPPDFFTDLLRYSTDGHYAVAPDADAWSTLLVKSFALAGSFDAALTSQIGEDTDVYENFNAGIGFIRYLIGYFAPDYIIPRTFSVGQSMEELGCGG